MSKTLIKKEAKPIKLGTTGTSTGIIIPAVWTSLTKLREEPYARIYLKETKYGYAIHIYKPKEATK